MLSAKYIVPEESTAIPTGWFIFADNAGPASPVKPAVVPPAIVVMIPLVLTTRIRLFEESAIYRLPLESNAMPSGPLNFADVACPLSPEKPASSIVPATVCILPVDLIIFIIRC